MSLLPTSYPGHSILTEDIGEVIDDRKCKCFGSGKRFLIPIAVAEMAITLDQCRLCITRSAARGCGRSYRGVSAGAGD